MSSRENTDQTRNVDRLLTLRQAAQVLGISINTIRKWAASRRIPIVKLNRAVRVRESALAELIERREILPAGDEAI